MERLPIRYSLKIVKGLMIIEKNHAFIRPRAVFNPLDCGKDLRYIL